MVVPPCLPFRHTIGDRSLYKALSSEEAVQRRKASACISRIGRAVTELKANEEERGADSAKIKRAVHPLLHFHPDVGGSPADGPKGILIIPAASLL